MTERADFKDSIRRLAATVISEPSQESVQTPVDAVTSNRPSTSGEQPKPRAKPAARSFRARPSSSDGEVPNVIAVTTRFPKEIDVLITKASFAQRMNERSPGTKQEILVEAAREWLMRNGYFHIGDQISAETEGEAV